MLRVYSRASAPLLYIFKENMNESRKNCDIRVFYCRNLAKDFGILPMLLPMERQNNVALEPVPCSGKIDPRYLLKAFEAGSRFVCILSCPKGECKLIEGNLRAARRVQAVKELLAEAGFNPESLRLIIPESKDAKHIEAAVELILGCLNKK